MSNDMQSLYGSENLHKSTSNQSVKNYWKIRNNECLKHSKSAMQFILICLCFALISCKQSEKSIVDSQDSIIKNRLDLINSTNEKDLVSKKIAFLDSLEKTGYMSKYLLKMKVKTYLASDQKEQASSYIYKLEKTNMAKDTIYYLKAKATKIGMHFINVKKSENNVALQNALIMCDSCLLVNPNNLECMGEKLLTLFLANRENDIISMTANRYQLENDTSYGVWFINSLRASALQAIGKSNDANELRIKLAEMRKDERANIYSQMAGDQYLSKPLKALQYIDSANKYWKNGVNKSALYSITAGAYVNSGKIAKGCSYADSAFNLGETGLVEFQNKFCRH